MAGAAKMIGRKLYFTYVTRADCYDNDLSSFWLQIMIG